MVEAANEIVIMHYNPLELSSSWDHDAAGISIMSEQKIRTACLGFI